MNGIPRPVNRQQKRALKHNPAMRKAFESAVAEQQRKEVASKEEAQKQRDAIESGDVDALVHSLLKVK